MNRDRKIKLLKGVAAGTIKITDLATDQLANNIELEIDYSNCTDDQLEAIIKMADKLGRTDRCFDVTDPKLSDDDRAILAELPMRPATGGSPVRPLDFNHLTIEQIDRLLKIAESNE